MVFSTDIDECNEDPGSDYSHNCHVDATCTNTAGSFTCACNTGYSGNGVDCTGKWRDETVVKATCCPYTQTTYHFKPMALGVFLNIKVSKLIILVMHVLVSMYFSWYLFLLWNLKKTAI